MIPDMSVKAAYNSLVNYGMTDWTPKFVNWDVFS